MITFHQTKIFTDRIDAKALEQLHELDRTKVFEGQPVRIMPDVHAGAGCVIGFTAPIKDKIIPNLVGVDIGCGMLCVELGRVNVDFGQLDRIIRENVPSGKNVGEPSDEAKELINRLRCKSGLNNRNWLNRSLGTLGGGNHFIEVDEDEDGIKYLVVHSGSRNLGKQVAEYYQNLAVKQCRSVSTAEVVDGLKAQGREKEISETLKALKKKKETLPADLCYLTGDAMEDYLHDMLVCTEFADRNRLRIVVKILENYRLKSVEKALLKSFTTRHNYIGEDRYIRKGAISAKKGERVLIPLNMRDGCIIGKGKGNPDWNYSAPHGAGRVMSRAEARRQLDLKDFSDAMKGIFSTTVSKDTIDEAPFAYKPSKEIIALVKATVDIEKIIKPIYNYKASE